MTACFLGKFILEISEDIKEVILKDFQAKNKLKQLPKTVHFPESIKIESFSKFLMVVNRGYLTKEKWNKSTSKLTSEVLLDLVVLFDFFGHNNDVLEALILVFRKATSVSQWNMTLSRIFRDEKGLKVIFESNFELIGRFFFTELRSVFIRWKLMSPDIYISCTRLLNTNKNNAKSFPLDFSAWEFLIKKTKLLFKGNWIHFSLPLVELMLYYTGNSPDTIIKLTEKSLENIKQFNPTDFLQAKWLVNCDTILEHPYSSSFFQIGDVPLTLSSVYSYSEGKMKVLIHFHNFHRAHQPDRVFAVFVHDPSVKGSIKFTPIILSTNKARTTPANSDNSPCRERPSNYVILNLKMSKNEMKGKKLQVWFYIKEVIALTALSEWMQRTESFMNEEAFETFLKESSPIKPQTKDDISLKVNLLPSMTDNLSILKLTNSNNFKEDFLTGISKTGMKSDSCPLQPLLSDAKRPKGFFSCACSTNQYISGLMFDSGILKNQKTLDQFSKVSGLLAMEMMIRKRQLHQKLGLINVFGDKNKQA